jgi:Heme-binding protein Shr-like, Hb-interacting domain
MDNPTMAQTEMQLDLNRKTNKQQATQMKIKNIVCIASILLASLSLAEAQTTLTTWTFDNVAVGINGSPAPSTGIGTASYLGVNTPNVEVLSGSSSGGANSWHISGWSKNATIGAQGAQFAASTFGYYQIQVSFDVYATTNAEANLQVQYTTDGAYWQNANITSAGTSGVLATNTITTNSLVVGSYIILTNNGTATWDNQVTVNLTGISGVDNDPNFEVRIVNASMGTNCLDTTGAIYNNASGGDWTFDNFVISGVSFDTVASWPFDNITAAKHINNPIPAIFNNTATAACIGFGTPANPLISSTFTPNNSTNDADVTANGAPYSSTGLAGQNVWRLRGQPGNGWLSTQPIGSQGAEFDVSTVNYTNILVTFDLYFTSQGEAKMCVLYTTDNWATTNVANNFACSTFPTLIVTNTPSFTSSALGGAYSANTVNGTLFFNSVGSQFYNYMSIDFSGIPGVANNPQFGFRIVNAAKNGDCVNALNQAYNNNSGNCRLDNVAVNGHFSGTIAPTFTSDPSATVDHPFTNTFSDSTGWYTNISSIYVNGVKLTNSAYAVTSSNIVYTPSTNAPVLTVAGYNYIVIYATNYTSAKLTQFVGTGVATKLAITQPTGPSASGGTLIANPSFTVTDQYGNGTTNPYYNMVVTATVSNSPATWTLGGSTVQPILNGSCTFTDLTATVIGTSAITNAAITFTVANGPITVTNSTNFIIGAPATPFIQGNLAAIQIDTTGNNTTFSIVEIKPSAAGQTLPVNITPITATGTNALRLSGSGSCGHLSLSDDGTFLVFAAFDDGSSATPDETFNLNRAVGIMNYTNLFTKTVKYVSDSFGGSQARSACSPDDIDFLICDKGGLYVGSPGGLGVNVYEQNNYCVRSFGGSAWVLTQKVVAGLPSPSVFQFNNGSIGELDYYDSGYDGPYNTISATPPPDGNVADFYMISTNGSTDPASFDILYTIDQNSGTNGSSGVITKWTTTDQSTWTNIGSWTNSDNGASLFVTTNGSGGAYLYYADGGGGTAKNNLIRLTDATVNGPLNITSSNVIYTASAGTSIEGVTFVPVPTANAVAPIPPPILTAQITAPVSSTFSVTNTPDDPAWRSAITGITVNGSTLPTAAYDETQSGKIVFDPSQSALLQSPGSKTIVISATGYSTNSIAQTLAVGAAAKLAITTQPTAPDGNGGPLATQPVVVIQDQYGNTTTSTANIIAAVGTGIWTIGGITTKAAVSGTAAFTDLTATSVAAVTGATIHFTSGSLTAVDSTPGFNIPAPIRSNLRGVTFSGGKLKFSFTNATGLNFSVLATNNLAAPIETWPVVGQAIESPAGSGNYQYTNSSATNAQQFYILRQP